MNSLGSISSVSHPTRATSTELSMISETPCIGNNHRESISEKRFSDEIFKSLTKKTKKKQMQRISEEGMPKQAYPASAPTVIKKKRGYFPQKTTQNGSTKLVSNLDNIQTLKKMNTNPTQKSFDQESKKSSSVSRSSFQSVSSVSSFRSNKSQDRKQVLNNAMNKHKSKSNSAERVQEKGLKNAKGTSSKTFESAFSSLRTNGKSSVNPAEKKYQEDKKKYDLQLKLIRIKSQEFSKKCKPKPVDWKKLVKTQVKQKVNEKVELCNESLRIMQNMQKTICDLEQDQATIRAEYTEVSDEMKARFQFFEETVAPYEEKMQNDINLRDQLLVKTTEQQRQLEYQKQINSNIAEDNSSISMQNLLLMEQIAALKAKKQQLLESQVEIDTENKQLKESADIKQQHLNILQKHYNEQASRSLWLKKEINLKKKGIFNIKIISEVRTDMKMEEIPENAINQSTDKNGELPKTQQNGMIDENNIALNQEQQQKQNQEEQTINSHYTCSIQYLLQNEFELLRSITDFEYFTPNQIYGFFYSESSYHHQLNLLLNFLNFFSLSSIKSFRLVIYDHEGLPRYPTSTQTVTSLDSIIDQIRSATQEDQQISSPSQNLGFTLHLDILNQQFYLGKQFNVLVTGINQSAASDNILRKLKLLFKHKKLPSNCLSPSENSQQSRNTQMMNTNNQLNEFIESIQKQIPLNFGQPRGNFNLNSEKKDQMSKQLTNCSSDNGGKGLSVEQQQQNQQIQKLKKVKYEEISPMINKQVKNIRILQGTPKGQKKKEITIPSSSNRNGTFHTANRRSQSDDRSGLKPKENKLQENLNKALGCSNASENSEEIQNIIVCVNNYFKKPNRLYTIQFDSSHTF